MHNVDLNKVGQACSRYADIVAVWAFGSAADGCVRPGSDQDIGVQFDPEPGIDRLCQLRADITGALDFEDVDLVLLNDASSILRFQAVSGNLLYSADEGKRAAFVSLACREYEDDMAGLARQMKWARELHGPPEQAND